MGRVVLKEFRNRPIRWARNALDWSGIGVHQIDRLTRYPRSSLTSLEPVLIFGPSEIEMEPDLVGSRLQIRTAELIAVSA